MRFLKNILLAAALSLACISCEDESVGPERDPFYDPNDLVGTDIGASITESYFVLSTSHSGNFENDNSDQYYYGFWAEFRLSDSSKCDIIDSVSITLSDGGSEIKRYKFSVGKYSYGYIGSTPILSRYYMHHYPSGAQPINYISPRYSCKVRLYNHNNDSTKAHTLNINTENYIKPGVFSCRWINSSDLEISLKEWSLTQNNNYGLLSYYSKDHKFLSFLTLDMSDFGNSFYIHGVPNDAAYYKIHLQDNYSGIDRQFEGKVIPLPQRNLGSATQVRAIKNINFIEYIKNLNKLVLVSSGSKEIALIDASSYETVWKKTLNETPAACKYDEGLNKIFICGSSGKLYSLDPATGSQIVLTSQNFRLDCLDVEGDYVIAFSRSGSYAIYNSKDGVVKNGILNIDSPYFRVSNFNYNKTSKKIYVLSDAVIYSFNFDLNTGNYSLINSDIMHKRTSDWGGQALLFNADEDKLITGWGLIYICSPDSANDLQYTGNNVSPLDDMIGKENSSLNIAISKRYYSLPPNISLISYVYSTVGRKTDIIGSPVKAISSESEIKVFMTIDDGSLAAQTFTIDDLFGYF